MRAFIPFDITTLNLTSSTASEPLSASAWSSGTTYAIGDMADDTDGYIYQSLVSSNLNNQPSLTTGYWQKVGYQEDVYAGGSTYALNATVSYNHRIYQSLQAGNIGHQPNLAASITWWEDIGAVNKWRCFDYQNNGRTVSSSPLTIVITPGKTMNSLALLGIEADIMTVSATSVVGGGSVYSRTIDLSTRYVDEWYTFFFADFTKSEAEILFDIPPYTDLILTVTLTRSSGNVGLRTFALGKYTDLGQAQHGAESDALNFSTIDRDLEGGSILIPRRSVPKTTQEVWTDANETDKLRALRIAANAVPTIWSGLADNTHAYFQALAILGVYKRWTINLAHAEKCISTIEIEEV